MIKIYLTIVGDKYEFGYEVGEENLHHSGKLSLSKFMALSKAIEILHESCRYDTKEFSENLKIDRLISKVEKRFEEEAASNAPNQKGEGAGR